MVCWEAFFGSRIVYTGTLCSCTDVMSSGDPMKVDRKEEKHMFGHVSSRSNDICVIVYDGNCCCIKQLEVTLIKLRDEASQRGRNCSMSA
jgi:hypothetical protein